MIRDRRTMPRYSCPHTYLSVGTENGGILVNLSDNGLAFQAMSSVQVGQKVQLRMVLPGSEVPITPEGQVVWTDETGELAGARLLNLSSEDQTFLRSWLASEKVNQPSGRKPAVLPKAARADSDSKVAPSDSGNVTQREEAGTVSAEGKQDELSHLRSAFQFKTLESETRTWLSGAIQGGRNLIRRKKSIAVASMVSLVVLVVLFELYYYTRRGVFQSAGQGIEASLQQFKKDAVEGGTMPAWVTRALSGAGSGTDEPKLPDAANREKAASSSVSGRNKKEAKLVSSGKDAILIPEAAVDRVTLQSAPPLALWHFRIQGNRQTLIVPANPTRPIPFSWAAADRSLGALPAAAPVETVSFGVHARAQELELYEPASYTRLALQGDTAGSVVLLATVDQDGSIGAMNLLSGNPVLAEAVMQAVRHWRYKPKVEDGKPVAGGNIRIEVTFSMWPH